MTQRAKVGSLEAIEAFRANLVVYMAQARSALEEVSGDVMRTRLWIENDQRRYWEGEFRRRRRELEEAQQALFSARLSQFSDAISLEQMAMHKARRALDEADAKLRTLKRWDRDFEGTVQPLVKQMEKLHTILSNDLVKAVVELDHIITTIAAYSQSHDQGALSQAAAPESTQSPDSGKNVAAGAQSDVSESGQTPAAAAREKTGNQTQ
jgi:chromosome segregation ATPase